MVVSINDPSLVVLIGPSGSGKSTFASRHFRPTEILSSDFCRALVCDDEADQTATDDAFELLHLILAKRLKRRLTTVIDATNVQAWARLPLLMAAKKWDIPAVAIVFALPPAVCHEQNMSRERRQVAPEIIEQQMVSLMSSMNRLFQEGFAAQHAFYTCKEVQQIEVLRSATYS